MASTTVTVTGRIDDDMGVPVPGYSRHVTLNVPITDGSMMLASTPVVVETDNSGAFSCALKADDDASTTPTGSYYPATNESGPSSVQTSNVIYVGATTSDAPTNGTVAVGDFVGDRTGKVWVCTAAGTPARGRTWEPVRESGPLTAVRARYARECGR